MADIIQNGAVSIYQDIELSLTEHLVPPVVHVKQFDHKARKSALYPLRQRCGVHDSYEHQPGIFRYTAGREAVPVQHRGAEQ